MDHRALVQRTGLAAIVAGVLLSLHGVVISTTPEGCIAGGCGAVQPRVYPLWAEIAAGIGILLLAVAVFGLARLARRKRAVDRWGRLPALLMVVGVTLAAVGLALGAIDHDLVPAGVVPGAACIFIGGAINAVVILRARILPTFVSVTLGVTTLALLGYNDQTWRVLLVVPFALAWMLLGYTMLHHGVRTAAE